MKFFRNAKLIVKIAIPLTMTMVISAGLVTYASSIMSTLSKRTAGIVDFQGGRLDALMHLRGGVTEAALMDRNMLLEQDLQKAERFKDLQQSAMTEAREAISRLVTLSDSPERRTANENTRHDIEAYFAILDRVSDLRVSGQREAAFKLARDVGIPARRQLNVWMNERATVQANELAAAKAQGLDEAVAGTYTLIGAAVAGLLSALVLAGLIVLRAINRPLGRLVGVLQRMAQGEIDAHIEEAIRGDEIGAVGRAVEGIKTMVARKAAEEAEVRRRADEAAAAERKRTMMELADGFEGAVGGIVGLVSASATELQATAQQMTASATETACQSTAVAAAAEQASANVNTVASAAEELGASVQEIGRQVSGSSDLAQVATSEADQTALQVHELSMAVTKVGDVVQLISTIAAQTNLLALNATIEAARAGEAGRGFAVVAAEVKELANQTARATDEISSQINLIQSATTRAVEAIGGITERIKQINTVAMTISAAVEEQGAATQEIVRNVAQASTGASEVTSNIAGVAQASEQTGAAATQVLDSASELSRQSEHLSAEVKRFLATVRAA
ncbi:methyl-accepting chemotaxis protein [Methylorubrum sp. SB2]|uniref:methyl-accepting chemotaxis protein n=1 Tax=Methylorubrum subtropicum TaxID=3138812 RepID=UPI00313C042C